MLKKKKQFSMGKWKGKKQNFSDKLSNTLIPRILAAKKKKKKKKMERKQIHIEKISHRCTSFFMKYSVLNLNALFI